MELGGQYKPHPSENPLNQKTGIAWLEGQVDPVPELVVLEISIMGRVYMLVDLAIT